MLNYPPASKDPLSQWPANKAFLEKPTSSTHQKFILGYLITQTERLQMCSTIHPCPGDNYFSILQVRHLGTTAALALTRS